MAATEILLGLLFLYPTFREIQKALKKKKAREIACWFESYAQSTLSFEKFETEMGKRCCKEIGKMIAKGYIRNYVLLQDNQKRPLSGILLFFFQTTYPIVDR